MRIILAVLLSLCMLCPVAFGDELTSNATPDVKVEGTTIPAYTNTGEEVNGRPQHLDANGVPIAEDLNPVERRIIVRDTIITNRPNLQNRAAQ